SRALCRESSNNSSCAMAVTDGEFELCGFGDSYLINGDTPTWFSHLAEDVRAEQRNFAGVGATSDALAKQVEEFEASNSSQSPNRIAVLHSGGNDLLDDINRTMSEPVHVFSAKICRNIETAISALNKQGVRQAVVSDVPFSPAVPEIKRLLSEYALCKGRDLKEVAADAVA
ncbi:hypothetical protein ACFOYZ_30035, partial [Neobacillus cucumis]|uniref:hypothetical protein n=1 Tax=Neobacillus cucumis TaxID=1740721 RepID=UPI003610DC31